MFKKLLFMLLLALFGSRLSAAPYMSVWHPSAIEVGQDFTISILTSGVDASDPLIGFGFDDLSDPSWTLRAVNVGFDFDDISAFVDADVAGFTFPGLTGDNILLASLTFNATAAGLFDFVIFSDLTNPDHGLLTAFDTYDLTVFIPNVEVRERGVGTVPEPGTLALIALGLLILIKGASRTTPRLENKISALGWRWLLKGFAAFGVLGALASNPAFALTANEAAKLLANDGAGDDHFGEPVAISGNTALIGAVGNNDNGLYSGSAYVFERNASGQWIQQTKLTPNDSTPLLYFGRSVSISGNTAIIGASGGNDNGTYSGSAYVFVRDGSGNWIQQAKLIANDGAADDHLGWSISISGDTALIGSWGDNNDSGSAYVFVRDGSGNWTQQAKLLASDSTAANQFGWSVSLSGDTALIGTPRDNDNGDVSGSAYVFVRDGFGYWSQQAKLLADDGALGDFFGGSVAVSGDTALIGAEEDDDIHPYSSGSAYVFVRDEFGEWNQQAKLLANDVVAYDFFGKSVSISGDTAIIGAEKYLDNRSAGSAYIFTHDESGNWYQEAKLLASDSTARDNFGGSVAVSGGIALIGASGDDDSGNDSGSAYVFDISAIVAEPVPGDIDGDGILDPYQDAKALRVLIGTRTGQTGFNVQTDFDADGRITLRDYQTWYRQYLMSGLLR